MSGTTTIDPEITWSLVADDDAPKYERCLAAVDLLVWIAKGGQISLYVEGLRPKADAIDTCESVLTRLIESV